MLLKHSAHDNAPTRSLNSKLPDAHASPGVSSKCVFLLLPVLFFCVLSPIGFAQDASRFEKEVLATGLSDPLQLDIALDGRVFFIERKGTVKLWEPTSRRTVTIGDFPAATAGDAGALGLTLARDFENSGHLYTIRYRPRARRDWCWRGSRSKVRSSRTSAKC
jgi:Glucose / Sorbosone dehydrogenase